MNDALFTSEQAITLITEGVKSGSIPLMGTSNVSTARGAIDRALRDGEYLVSLLNALQTTPKSP